jgi:predicted amino acid racemase
MRIEFDGQRVRANAAAVVEMCAARGIRVVGVTKGSCGNSGVARAMLSGGVQLLGESTLANVRRLRDQGVRADIMLLRLPGLSEVDDVVGLSQVSLNSETETVHALARAARARGTTHQVILMVDMGDRREGVLPEQAADAARTMLDLPGTDLVGIGTNFGCISGVVPTLAALQRFVGIAEEVERALGIRFRVVSAGGSDCLEFVDRGEIPPRVNQLRVGEAILLGVGDAPYPLPIPHQDAFNVVAEVIEIKTKPSLPEGRIGYEDAPPPEDQGMRRRAILDGGKVDACVRGLRPTRPGVTIVGASSEHLVVDVTDARPQVLLGDQLEFAPDYEAVATAMHSAASLPRGA